MNKSDKELKQAEAYVEKDPVDATFLSFADKFIENISAGIHKATTTKEVVEEVVEDVFEGDSASKIGYENETM